MGTYRVEASRYGDEGRWPVVWSGYSLLKGAIDDAEKQINHHGNRYARVVENDTGAIVWSIKAPEHTTSVDNTSIPSSNVSSEGSAGSALMGLVFIGIIGWAIWNYGISGLGDMFNRFNAVQYTADSVGDFADHINSKGYCTVSPDHEKCNPAAYTGDYYADGFIVKLGNAEAYVHNGEAEITGISGTKTVPLNKAVGTILSMQ